MSQLIGSVLIFYLSIISGVIAQSSRVVNGTDAPPGKFPFMVSLLEDGDPNCGATLINQRWVLTAAHCVTERKSTELLPLSWLSIQYGSTELKATSKNIVKISKIFVHKGYVPFDPVEHDIALLKLKKSIAFSDAVQAVRLPNMNQFTPGNTAAILLGWGRNETLGQIQQHLQMVTLQIFTIEECRLRHEATIYSTNICAGVPEGGKGQCKGDSGGPLLVNGTQVGIVSWSEKPCTKPGFPGVFTRVSAYVDWITKTIADEARFDLA